MGRARPPGARPAGTGGGALRRLLLIAALALACTEITGDSDRIIAVEILGPLARTVEEGDTLQLEARALDANGDVVPALIEERGLEAAVAVFRGQPAVEVESR